MGLSWQGFPLMHDPIILSLGSFSLTWYALLYLTGIISASIVLWYRRPRFSPPLSRDQFWELIVFVLWGVLLGARLGYVIFYGDRSYLIEPWRVFSPFDFSTSEWTGIRGLSFFGGLLGGATSILLFSRKSGISFWKVADWVVPAVPLGILFGRLGNFLNLELPGRTTQMLWGMHFPPDIAILRHPSTLYEALGEGLVLFLFLWFLTSFPKRPGVMTASFLMGYGVIRFCLEFFRAPDPGFPLLLSLISYNQLLAFGCFLIGGILFLRLRRRVM
jgi:phosphatidylglycerol---prolipoprotein diacylglyceryl transferase